MVIKASAGRDISSPIQTNCAQGAGERDSVLKVLFVWFWV